MLAVVVQFEEEVVISLDWLLYADPPRKIWNRYNIPETENNDARQQQGTCFCDSGRRQKIPKSECSRPQCELLCATEAHQGIGIHDPTCGGAAPAPTSSRKAAWGSVKFFHIAQLAHADSQSSYIAQLEACTKGAKCRDRSDAHLKDCPRMFL